MINLSKDFSGKKFWFTYQYCTRGRIYPVQSILNPQSDKRGKALLKFIDGDVEPLTTRGEYWAKHMVQTVMVGIKSIYMLG